MLKNGSLDFPVAFAFSGGACHFTHFIINGAEGILWFTASKGIRFAGGGRPA
jgi:hypothetical protein